jgi:hypothetical protein
MRIGLISRIGPKTPREQLQGYNQVMAWHIHRELSKHCECILIPDGILGDWHGELRVDHAIAISAVALKALAGNSFNKLLEERTCDARTDVLSIVRSRCKHLWWLTDGPIRSIVPWGEPKTEGAYIGMGVDPEVCRPESVDPVVLFNAWNAIIDREAWDDPMLNRMLVACEEVSKQGVQVWGMNCKPTCATNLVGRDLGDDKEKLGYVPWLDICAAYRMGAVFLDGTPKVIELGRVEAAACGNLLLVPEVISQDPLEGLQFLPQVYWNQDVNLAAQLLHGIEIHQNTARRELIHEMVCEYFDWEHVAKRILIYLQARQHSTVGVSTADSDVNVHHPFNPSHEEPPTPYEPKQEEKAPWVDYPISVPPSCLYWQHGDAGTEKLIKSVHYRSAHQLLDGMPPEETEYAKRMKTQQAGVHGKPKKFWNLLQSMRDKGYDGPPIIAGINRRGEIVIHDGFHRAACAAAIALQRIPVVVHHRDEDWIAFRHSLRALNGGHKLYQPVGHPDLTGWPAWRKDTPRRIQLIANTLKTWDAVETIADVGCHSGVIACGLAREGYDVTGVDLNEKAIAAANMLASMSDIGPGPGGVRFFCNSHRALPCEVDAIVCLSALNHAMVKGNGETMLRELAKLTPRLVLDCPVKGDPVGGDQPWADPGVFSKWVTDTIGGKVWGGVGVNEGLQRPLFFWRHNA